MCGEEKHGIIYGLMHMSEQEMKGKVWKFSLVVVVMACFMYAVWFMPDHFQKPPDAIVSEQWTLRFVSGTEYNVGEAGQVIVEVRNQAGSSVATNCTMSVWYPDKSLFLSQLGQPSATGNQYVNFTIPAVTGVYEYQANCTLPGNRDAVVSKSFHVSEFQNETLTKLRRIKAVSVK